MIADPGGHPQDETMLWLCDIRLPALGSGVRKARNLVDALGLALPADARDDLRLLISEVMTNAIRHGSTGQHEARPAIRVRVGLEDVRVRVEIHDRGPGFEPAPRGPGAELDSGWGVHFVDQLADRWGTGREDDDWVVWFEVRLPRRPDVSAAMSYDQRAADAPAAGDAAHDPGRTVGRLADGA
ncbi:MAG: ATP-binding protein, partial [Solirubrobacterales bacterium]|nr:ATP-binding protein [Solirubrobacterales bacterium]